MDPRYQFKSAKPRFQAGGCELQLEGNIVTATRGSIVKRFRLPSLLQANQGGIPGWFFAGIWDEMGLPAIIDYLDSYYLTGWDFYMPDKSPVWLKGLPSDKSKVLIYSNSKFYISDKEENLRAVRQLPPHADLVADIPRASIYHVVKLFEEQGWFNEPEEAMPSQNISGYIV